jgi:hypothetical protein
MVVLPGYMTEQTCLNCNDPDTDRYDLMIRGNDHEGVYLCEECYEAVQRELEEE